MSVRMNSRNNVTSEVLTNFAYVDFCLLRRDTVYTVESQTDVSEENMASIFRIYETSMKQVA
jgi:hypothetical protein